MGISLDVFLKRINPAFFETMSSYVNPSYSAHICVWDFSESAEHENAPKTIEINLISKIQHIADKLGTG
jgi:hypothetical protein